MAANSDFLLNFQEFDSSESHLGGNGDATTISIEDTAAGSHKPQKQRRSAPVTSFEEDNDPLANDDKTEVRERILGSLLPWPGKNFVHLYIRNNPDLYGPFWICATLVFVIAICGNISNFLVYLGKPQYKYVPEFQKVTIAATAIYSYAWLVPLALWGLLVWRNSKVMNIVSYSFLEIVCVYGYSLAVYIPTVVLWIIPYEAVRWFSIVVALCLSGSVLVLTFWPAVRDDQRRVAVAIMTAIVSLHILLAFGCKAYFFSTLEVEHTAVNAVVGHGTKSSLTMKMHRTNTMS